MLKVWKSTSILLALALVLSLGLVMAPMAGTVEAATINVNITPTSGLTTTEAGGTNTFNVNLNATPAGNVTVILTSDNTNEGTVSPGSLIFGAANWSTNQIVTVTGVDDWVGDGDIVYNITTTASSDNITDTVNNPADVVVTNIDDDTVGINVTPTSGLTTTEDGGSDAFTMVLNTQPTTDVTIGLSSNNTNEGTVSPTSLTFTNLTWNITQIVTVTGVDDWAFDGNIVYLIVTSNTSSTDPTYDDLDVDDVEVTNVDNDVPEERRGGAAPDPASFSSSYLRVSSSQVNPNQPVTISINVANTGGESGGHSVNLYVNGRVEQSKTVSASPGSTQSVLFTVTKGTPGTYNVMVEGQNGQFIVASTSLFSGGLGGGLDSGGIVVIVLVLIALIAAVAFIMRSTRGAA